MQAGAKMTRNPWRRLYFPESMFANRSPTYCYAEISTNQSAFTGRISAMAMPPSGKTTLTVLVTASAKKQAQHALLDRGVSMSSWIDGLLKELAQSAQRRSVHVVRDDLQDGK
jgi:hypothetical protein